MVNLATDFVVPSLAATNPAVLNADGKTISLTMDEPMKSTSILCGHRLHGEGDAERRQRKHCDSGCVEPADGNGQHRDAEPLSTPIAHNDINVAVSYATPTTAGKLEDRVGNDLSSFTDQAVTNNSVIPRVSIVAVHADSSPGIDHAGFRVARSNRDANSRLKVNFDFAQADSYLSSTIQTINIPANATSATAAFPSYYECNTSGNLTATVAGDDNYVSAIAPGRSASVRMKVPASGKTLTIAPDAAAYAVTESDVIIAAATPSSITCTAFPRATACRHQWHGSMPTTTTATMSWSSRCPAWNPVTTTRWRSQPRRETATPVIRPASASRPRHSRAPITRCPRPAR